MNEKLMHVLTSRTFVDTNVLFYAVNIDNPEKYARASAALTFLWQQDELPTISTQILQELYVTLIRSKVDIDAAQKIVKDYFVWNVIAIGTFLIDEAFHFQRRYLLSFWDSLVLASAQLSHCKYLLTEDLNHGQKYGKVMAINPFHDGYGA